MIDSYRYDEHYARQGALDEAVEELRQSPELGAILENAAFKRILQIARDGRVRVVHRDGKPRG